jgi:hypothetical protein
MRTLAIDHVHFATRQRADGDRDTRRDVNVMQAAFVKDIEVVSDGTTLARFGGADLNALLTNPVREGQSRQLRHRVPTRSARVQVAQFRCRRAYPHHVASPNHAGDTGTIEGDAIDVQGTPLATPGPPLSGEVWMAAGGPSNRAPHRHAVFQLDGKLRISQRFAIDSVTQSGRPEGCLKP